MGKRMLLGVTAILQLWAMSTANIQEYFTNQLLSQVEIPQGLGAEHRLPRTFCRNKFGENWAGCCNENFDCVTTDRTDYCVYNNSIIRPDPQFCRNQRLSCFHCCIEGQGCANKIACDNYFEDNRQNAFLIAIVIYCTSSVALISFMILIALRYIRLGNVKELKKRHKVLSDNAQVSEAVSANDSRISSPDD